MVDKPYTLFIYHPAGDVDPALAIGAARAGAVGVFNAEDGSLDDVAINLALDRMALHAGARFGVRLVELDADRAAGLLPRVPQGLAWVIVDRAGLGPDAAVGAPLRQAGVRLLAEVTDAEPLDEPLVAGLDGLVLKGNESGGLVGDDASFILLQKWLGRTALPLYLRGGVTPHVAAACAAVGMAGGVIDAQVLLMPESPLRDVLQPVLGSLSGNETQAVGDGEAGQYYRVLMRPGHALARTFAEQADGLGHEGLRAWTRGRVNWREPRLGLLPVGHDVCFAAAWARQYGHLAALVRAFDDAVAHHHRQAVQARAITAGAPLAEALGTALPVIQGPMTRVSDSAAFAQHVAEGGALPMLALALLKGTALTELLAETAQRLQGRRWGIGLLGFAPQALLDEQLAESARHKPDFALIAGGRPDQAVHLERSGIPTFLHVPSANLLPMFLAEGARRFIFEGRECGGHIGPLSSFVLWSTMIDRMLADLPASKVPAQDVQLIFAGGIHDALSSAMVQVMAAPLAARGVRIGILMGSAYLFTDEIVDSGAVVSGFQREVLACERTVNLESGPGHASRCGYTPFARDFFARRKALREQQVPAEEARQVLDDLILGRLRIASKGRDRGGADGALRELTDAQQHEQGMYMLGQVAMLRDHTLRIADLHRQVTDDAAALLAQRLLERTPDTATGTAPAQPADIAIVGIGCVLPRASSPREFWENIVERVDAITEVPRHRWDWRLYFDADRHARDKIYSKWGGFLDDLPFDPTRYGMPPKSIESVDPMQLMALEVAFRTLVDAGYAGDLPRPLNRERAAVILGASGGTGDLGSQYGLRAELPRFAGSLPEDVARRLPEWTEDSFAGILLNVIAGRIANRLNFGGVNYTTDAACGSSLAAVYQAVSELTAGRADFVLAGGVDTVQGPFGYLCFSKTQALSPRGRCATFDSEGDGIAIAEGIAMVALKRLADAERDGDRIYAVIKGAGGSSDGNAKGLTAPLPAGQLRAMRRAYAQAGYGPHTVGLFEAHGTGTVAGDTAELESTTRLIAEHAHAPRQAVVGSVKTNIGHTKASAGVAGMIKAALSLHHRVLPPHLHVRTPNAILRDERNPLHVIAQPRPWLPEANVPRRASCSAFGFGGTNFHVTMQEYAGEYRPWLQAATTDRWPAELLLWGEVDRAALVQRIDTTLKALADTPALALRDLAASLARHYRSGSETLAIVAGSASDLATRLGQALAYLRGEATALAPGVVHGAAGAQPGKVAVLFPGQGSQYPDMLRDLSVRFGECAQALADADAALREPFEARFGAGQVLSRFVLPRGAYADDDQAAARAALTRTDVAQPALGAAEVGLWRLMQRLGLSADMFAGHSYGEFVALHAAGAFDFDALMNLSAARGRYIVDAAQAAGSELGTMAAVQATRKAVEGAIAGIDGVIVANHNAPLQCILSGTRAAVAQASQALRDTGIEVTDIPVAAAFHSVLVRPAQAALAETITATPWQPLRVPVYSNARAEAHGADVEGVRRAMADHLVQPVEFVAEVQAMADDGARVFVEVGPKSVLTRLVGKILEGRDHVAVALDDGQGLSGLLKGLAQLACAGVPLQWSALFEGRDCRLGDPTDLASLQRLTVLPRHAWLLNGSRARRAGEPAQQIGVTVEDVAALTGVAGPTPAAAAAAALPPAAASTPPNEAAPGVAPTQYRSPLPDGAQAPRPWKKELPMTDRRSVPPTLGSSAVMSEYFDTMRQFLETQERVMAMFMGADAGTPARPAVRALRTAPVLPRLTDVAGQMPAAAVPAVAAAAVPQPVAPAVVAAAAPQAIATPVPVPAAVASAPIAAAPVAAPAAKVPAPAPAPAAALSRDALVDMLLSIVEEKTGYPRDMVGLDQNLESDLGIDSIKRIEVVGAMMQRLPEPMRVALTDSRTRLNTQATLNGMLEILGSATAEGAGVPFDSAGVGATAGRNATASHPPRHVIVAEPEPVPTRAARRLRKGLYVIADDALGVAPALAGRLVEHGCTAVRIDADTLADEVALQAWLVTQRPRLERLAGLVHLGALGSAPVAAQAGVSQWRRALQQSEKSLYQLLHALDGALPDGACVLAACGLGGCFGHDPVAPADSTPAPQMLRLQGGAVGLIKSLHEERPDLRVRAIDLDPSHPDTLLPALWDELELVGGRHEVGYPAGRRTVFRTVAADAKVDDNAAAALASGALVVLATGGARGITAEVLREVARPGATLVLTGRSALPDTESGTTAALTTPEALRQHFVAEVRGGSTTLKLADVPRRVQAVLAEREMRSNIGDFRARGAEVEYHAVDVTREADLSTLIAGVRARHGAIHGVVHGAGVIEDKRLVDKQPDSWSRVVETKVIGLLLLHKLVPAQDLRFFGVFSSVAGRYGNSGQSDYATANELMNRLCRQMAQGWAQRVQVRAWCWGPWGPTQFGAGMVTAETEAKFAAKGVTLVSAQEGRRLFADELRSGPTGAVEVVCGAGPWEVVEAERGAIVLDAGGPWLGPLLGPATHEPLPTGVQHVSVVLDDSHAYLKEHRIDGTPVLPAAAAMEMICETARRLWPGWQVVQMREFRLMKGVELRQMPRTVRIEVNPPPYGSSEGFEVVAVLQSELSPGRWVSHYRGVVRLEQQFAPAPTRERSVHVERALAVRTAYDEWLFHGPRFQVIEAIRGLSARGSVSQVHATAPTDWMVAPPAEAASTGWVFDPALIDAAAQMALLWDRAFRGESCLPTAFGRVQRYVAVLPHALTMDFERLDNPDPAIVHAHVHFIDAQGRVVLEIEDLQCISAAALNRLGGTHLTQGTPA